MADIALNFDFNSQKFLYQDDEPTSPGDTKTQQLHNYADGVSASQDSAITAYSFIIPNEETLQAIREAESGVGLVYFESDQDFYQDLES